MIKGEYFLKIKREISWPMLLKKFGLRMSFQKRAGRKTIGIMKCPFHQEKHPSCAFFKDGGFRCFGCGAGYDIFDFVRVKLQLSVVDTILFFYREFGIPLPNGQSLQTIKKPGHWPH